MKLEYLIFNLVIFISPFFAYLFYPQLIFAFNIKTLISISLSSFIFVLHDILVTNKWWYFNKKYILGFRIFNLPIEEIIFFFSVSYSCLTIYLNLLFLKTNTNQYLFLFPFIVFIVYFYICLRYNKPYIKTFFIFYLFLIFFDFFIAKTKLIVNFKFITFLIIVFVLTLIFNYYLTKRQIVLYNKKIITGVKILTIPIEDFLYGLTFIYLVTIIYHFL
ncbi:MAG: lycopene cyclase domain-containing protein [Microgenomates group bacterium]